MENNDNKFLRRQREENAIAWAEETKNSGTIAFVTLAENNLIDEVTASEHADMFLPWEPGVQFKDSNIRSFNGELYKCLQDHISQEDWTPDKTPSLWKKIGDPTAEYPEWSQPVGAGDAYMKGDKVSFEDKHWVSTVDNNVWAPGVYGWEEVK